MPSDQSTMLHTCPLARALQIESDSSVPLRRHMSNLTSRAVPLPWSRGQTSEKGSELVTPVSGAGHQYHIYLEDIDCLRVGDGLWSCTAATSFLSSILRRELSPPSTLRQENGNRSRLSHTQALAYNYGSQHPQTRSCRTYFLKTTGGVTKPLIAAYTPMFSIMLTACGILWIWWITFSCWSAVPSKSVMMILL